MKRIALLGSTGSIGTQALSVIAEHPEVFAVSVLTAGRNADLLIQQAHTFHPRYVVIADESQYDKVRLALSNLPIQVYAGAEAISQVVQSDEVDMVLTAMVGFAGLRPTLAAIDAHKPIALANKETLVVAGELIMRRCQEQQVPILPVDSEHSAIFQCLQGAAGNPPSRILLTASGGPFLHYSTDQLAHVTLEQALQHPNWSMGAKITIDSATMLNKGLELIEAKWLFGLSPESIEVVVHPESVIHSAVAFADGAIIAQMGTPDMRLPIQYAFSYPQRLPLSGSHLCLTDLNGLHFLPPDTDRFPCLQLAYEAIRKGGNLPCILNAANEVANEAFRAGRIAFMYIPHVIATCMQQVEWIAAPTLDELFYTDALTRRHAATLL